ncbi:hypothetical protein PR202_ga12722 [Eleusine coracana subsp. coracana]|uniref:Uncharacterized protein n=1 Tax=Eleusine coracana subsp. coracana TaxID=191504 RepID=A0AAV5CCX9_ELECO|nr:hypothetical protein PR202_ga12722 [Eleusine coracana subsp. coracana]
MRGHPTRELRRLREGEAGFPGRRNGCLGEAAPLSPLLSSSLFQIRVARPGGCYTGAMRGDPARELRRLREGEAVTAAAGDERRLCIDNDDRVRGTSPLRRPRRPRAREVVTATASEVRRLCVEDSKAEAKLKQISGGKNPIYPRRCHSQVPTL